MNRGGKDTLVALLVVVDDETYAIPCEDVLEVVPLPMLVPVPGAPASLEGTFSFRGEIVPVVDLGRALGRGPSATRLSARVVIVRTPRGLLGAHVARVSDVKRIAAPSRSIDVPRAPVLAETTTDDGRPIHLLALDRSLPSELDGLVGRA